MMKKTLVVSSGLLAALALLLGACASPNDQQGTGSGRTATSTSAAPTTGGSTSPSHGEPRDQIKVVATGTVQPGVEPGCLILDTGKERYVLLSKDKSKLTAGSRVQVTGVRSPGQISYCQQGTPLEVQTVRPVS